MLDVFLGNMRLSSLSDTLIFLVYNVLCFWDLKIGDSSPVFLLNFFFKLVFSIITANVFEHVQSRSGCCVRVDVEDVSTFDLLEQSHSRVSLIILHHSGVVLSLFNVFRWMLEDASSTVSALAWVVQEVLAYRREVLSAERLFLLKFFLSVGESTSLFLELVLALLASQPEPTKFCLDLPFPSVLCLDTTFRFEWSAWFNIDI